MKITRGQLYELVRIMPATRAAQMLRLSSVHHICKVYGIPMPGRGYWQRRAAGHPVMDLPPPLGDPTTEIDIEFEEDVIDAVRKALSRTAVAAPKQRVNSITSDEVVQQTSAVRPVRKPSRRQKTTMAGLPRQGSDGVPAEPGIAFLAEATVAHDRVESMRRFLASVEQTVRSQDLQARAAMDRWLRAAKEALDAADPVTLVARTFR